jgi:hypothetical protein
MKKKVWQEKRSSPRRLDQALNLFYVASVVWFDYVEIVHFVGFYMNRGWWSPHSIEYMLRKWRRYRKEEKFMYDAIRTGEAMLMRLAPRWGLEMETPQIVLEHIRDAIPTIELPDWRPIETIPEDYYAG